MLVTRDSYIKLRHAMESVQQKKKTIVWKFNLEKNLCVVLPLGMSADR